MDDASFEEESLEPASLEEPSAFVAVVEAIDLGDRTMALKLLSEVQCMGKSDIELLRDLLDDDKSYVAIHPYRLELRSRSGRGKPLRPYFVRLEEERSIANKLHYQLSKGKNLKAALHAVHLESGLEENTIRKIWQSAHRFFAKRSPFASKLKHTK